MSISAALPVLITAAQDVTPRAAFPWAVVVIVLAAAIAVAVVRHRRPHRRRPIADPESPERAEAIRRYEQTRAQASVNAAAANIARHGGAWF